MQPLYMIGNAHIDPVWLWRWQDGFEAVRATFRSALDRMNEYPDFIFTSACAVYYKWIKESEPEMFEEIRQRVNEGRWRITGGFWLQPDINIPSGESLARQALLGQGFFKENFGKTVCTGYNVDSFGHSGTLPKILNKCGIINYVYMRPGTHERQYKGANTFVWQSPEGGSVTAFRIESAYCTGPDEIGTMMDRCEQVLERDGHAMCFYGVGNHGGGPTRRNIDYVISRGGKFSSPDEYFESIKGEDLPTETGDLFVHAPGCYSAHSGIKMLNRQTENALLTAEKLSVLAGLDAGSRLKTAWEKLAFNQFHDILAGTCIKPAYDDAAHDLGYALSEADNVSNLALQRIARKLNVPFIEDAFPYVVFNPHSFPVKAPVLIDTEVKADEYVLCDCEMQPVPHALLKPTAAVGWRKKLCFMAEVPPLGVKRYTLVKGGHTPVPFDDSLTLDNGIISAEVDNKSGEIISLKLNGVQMLGGATQVCIFDDDSDTWSHAKPVFNGEYLPLKEAKTAVTESNAVRKVISTVVYYGDSQIRRDYTLYSGSDQLDIAVRIDWRETQKMLKLAFPVAAVPAHVRVQEPFGFALKPDLEFTRENPMQEWVDMSSEAGEGLAVLNNGKYSYDAHDNAICISAIRSPYYANHEPYVVTKGEDYPVIDYGVQEFALKLLPHSAEVIAQIENAAQVLNSPLIIQPEYAHSGELGGSHSFGVLKSDSAVIDALKQAEDGRGIIVHIHETAQKHTLARLELFGNSIDVELTPGEIKAYRLYNGTWTSVNLLEINE